MKKSKLLKEINKLKDEVKLLKRKLLFPYYTEWGSEQFCSIDIVLRAIMEKMNVKLEVIESKRKIVVKEVE